MEKEEDKEKRIHGKTVMQKTKWRKLFRQVRCPLSFHDERAKQLSLYLAACYALHRWRTVHNTEETVHEERMQRARESDTLPTGDSHLPPCVSTQPEPAHLGCYHTQLHTLRAALSTRYYS